MNTSYIKKLLLLISLLALVPTLSKAQQWDYGFQIGLNQTDFKSDFFYHPQLLEGDISPKITFGLNTVIRYVPNKIGISIEPGYIMKALSAPSKNVQERELDATLHLINLPLMLVIEPNRHFNIFVGPEIAYNFYTEREPENYQNPFIKKFDLAVSLGGMVQLKERYGIGLKYSYGLTSLTDKEVTISTSGFPNDVDSFNTKTKSTYLQLFFRYML